MQQMRDPAPAVVEDDLGNLEMQVNNSTQSTCHTRI